MIKKIFLLLIPVVMINSCISTGNKDAEPTTGNKLDSVVFNTGIDIIPDIRNMDSLQILFYDNPDSDSLRYDRYFTYVSLNDTSFINTLLENLAKPFQQYDAVKKCRSEGKMYIYSNGRPINTVYFSTRCDKCCYLYYIHHGRFYYIEITNEIIQELKRHRQNAKTP